MFLYNNIVEKHFSISIAPVRSRGASLVINIDRVVGTLQTHNTWTAKSDSRGSNRKGDVMTNTNEQHFVQPWM
jgi:hypothetical protein